MENNMETTQGDHPQVPPAKPPDDGQPNEEVPVNGAHVLNEAMSEDTSEDETPMVKALAAAKNGVSLPVKSASDSGGDHVGTPGGGPEVIAQDHVGAENHGPGETVPPPTPDQGSGMPPKSRNLDKQAAKVSRSHFDKRMKELINATRDLAQEQHTGSMTDQGRIARSKKMKSQRSPKMTSLQKKPETSSTTAGKKKRNKTNGSVKSRHPKTSRVR